jgi:uncharacterized membrane protein YfcA
VSNGNISTVAGGNTGLPGPPVTADNIPATSATLDPKNFGAPFWIMLAMTIPAVLPGTLTGVWLYARISEVNFKRACFMLLGISGIGLFVKALLK